MAKKRPQAGRNLFSEKLREIAAILIIGFTIFALASTMSYKEPGLAQDGGISNLCGATGAILAHYMLYAFGYASYAMYACLGLWGVVLFTRKALHGVASKVIGLVFFTSFLSALLSHLLQGSSSSIPHFGGLVGFYLDDFFTSRLALGVVGARIILVVLFLITFILATDWLFFSALVAFGRWLGERREKMRKKAKDLARKRAAEEAAQKAAQKESMTVPPPVEMRESPKREDAVKRVLEKELKKEQRKSARREKAKAGGAAPADAADDAKEGEKKAAPSRARSAATPAQAAAAAKRATTKPKKQVEYKKPAIDLLDRTETVPQKDLERMISRTSTLLEKTLRSFKIDADVVEIERGPVITMFELDLAPGIKVERIRALEDNIAMAVKAPGVRIVAPLPGKSTVGIEVPNSVRETVRLREIINSTSFKDSYAIPISLGRDAAGHVLVDDLAKMPHLLVAGSTGAGKSVCLNSIIVSILYTRTPDQVKLILVDPKMVELSSFKDVPHLMCPVVVDMKRAAYILEWATKQMDARYTVLHAAGVRNIYGYNKLGEKELRNRLGALADDEEFRPFMPFVVLIVDELADLMMTGAREVEAHITRLAQKSRAVGIHLILATQRPSTNVITGLIKANMPTRIGFKVATKVDSRVVLDINGAEQLLGQGDMLYLPPRTSNVVRAQGSFVSDDEIRKVTEVLKEQSEPTFEPVLVQQPGAADFDPSSVDELYEQAAEFIIETQRGSASLLQRHFSIGYTRASRLIDLMQQDGVLGEYKGSQAREVIMTREEWDSRLGDGN